MNPINSRIEMTGANVMALGLDVPLKLNYRRKFMSSETENIRMVGNHVIGCSIKDWQIVTFKLNGGKEMLRIVRGTITWDRDRPYEPGYWVCSTVLAAEFLDEGIVYSQNTCYQLIGEGELHETPHGDLYGYLHKGLDFQQATWAFEQNLITFDTKH